MREKKIDSFFSSSLILRITFQNRTLMDRRESLCDDDDTRFSSVCKKKNEIPFYVRG